MGVIVSKLEDAGQVEEGNAKWVQQLEAVVMAAANKIFGCSRTRSKAVVLWMQSLETNNDLTKLKSHATIYNARCQQRECSQSC